MIRFIIIVTLFVFTTCDDYYTRRARILELESKMTLGGNITLTDKETIVNNCLMMHKFKETDYGFTHPEEYQFSDHFFKYKTEIPKSKVYKIIKSMPKGAVLHIHDTAILGPDYLLNITYRNQLYVCFGKRTHFLFSNKIPYASCDSQWQLMSDVRRNVTNIKKFDLEIRNLFTLTGNNPGLGYPDIGTIWKTFRSYFGHVYSLLTYKPIWEQYVYDVLTAFRDDNVMYAELRTTLPLLYDLNGTYFDKKVTAEIYNNVLNKFVRDHPDFYGARLIYATSRTANKQNMTTNIQTVKEWLKDYPDLIVGYDLIGQEDLGRPLLEFAPLFEEVKDVNFFFHAGETNWYGTSSDENLIDAILLGAKRIGHAYALTKHPELIKQVIEKDIAIEVTVISNAVLSLVRDVRNHPLSIFLSLGLPVVLSSDDPGVWEADPLSDDFYVAFVDVASKHSDLRMLKTLAINSLKYSALDQLNKQQALSCFDLKWNRFIEDFNCSVY